MVECGCWAVVVVCGQPRMFVVVEVTCGRRGGRWLLRWWLWEAVSLFVTRVTFGSRMRARAHERARAQICTIHTIYNFIALIIQFCSVVSNTKFYSVPL